ncbi:magnesium/cobalt transporter CorA [Neisseria animaloris]|uniref:magnesium/cobalt transporter CorA n=1 Tax=Neisseria animaloris TaxID=326522 RepID=UPI0039DFBC51
MQETLSPDLIHNADETVPRSNIDGVPQHAVHQTVYSPDTFFQTDYFPDGHPPVFRQPQNGETNWLHFVGITDTALLKNALAPYGIHDLVLEDILSRKQRPKIEDYGNYIFIAARVYQYTSNKLQSDQVYLIIGTDFVFTFQQRPLGLFSPTRRQLHDNRHNIRSKDAAFLAYRFIDRMIDDYFLTLDKYDNFVENIDKTLFSETAENKIILSRIHRLKRDAVRLRRTLQPLRDVLYQLAHGEFAIFHGEPRLYLRDVYDHTMQLMESLDASRDMVLSMMDIYLSFQSNRLNRQMRVLTVITIIFMPLTVITGIYGMNFEYMPELRWHYGYFMVLGLMILIIIGLLVFFYRRKWL